MRHNAKEILEIKRKVLDAIPHGVDRANVIIALAQIQADFGELIREGYGVGDLPFTDEPDEPDDNIQP